MLAAGVCAALGRKTSKLRNIFENQRSSSRSTPRKKERKKSGIKMRRERKVSGKKRETVCRTKE